MPSRINKSIFDKISQAQPGKSLPRPGGDLRIPSYQEEDSRDRMMVLAEDGAKLIFSLIAQIVVIAAGAFLWWYFGGAIRSMLGGVLAGAIVAASLDLLVRAKLADRGQVLRFGLFWWLKWLGVALFALFLSGLIGGSLPRVLVNFSPIMFSFYRS